MMDKDHELNDYTCDILSSEFYTVAILDKVILIIRTRTFRQ
jgi:hypothetical protein